MVSCPHFPSQLAEITQKYRVKFLIDDKFILLVLDRGYIYILTWKYGLMILWFKHFISCHIKRDSAEHPCCVIRPLPKINLSMFTYQGIIKFDQWIEKEGQSTRKGWMIFIYCSDPTQTDGFMFWVLTLVSWYLLHELNIFCPSRPRLLNCIHMARHELVNILKVWGDIHRLSDKTDVLNFYIFYLNPDQTHHEFRPAWDSNPRPLDHKQYISCPCPLIHMVMARNELQPLQTQI